MKKILITLLSLTVLLFSSCNPINQASTEQTTKEGYGSITLNFSQKSRTISPYTVDFSQCQWEITITDLVTNQNVKDPSYNPTSNPNNITTKLSRGDTLYKLNNIPNGLYSVKAKSQFYPNSSSADSVNLYAEETVSVNGPTTLALTVGFVKTTQGRLSGTVNISTTLDSNSFDVEAYLYDAYDPSDESRISLTCTYNADDATYSISYSSDSSDSSYIASGYYFLILMAKPHYESAETTTGNNDEPYFALNIGDNLIEIADGLTTQFNITANDNFSTKTFYAKQDAPIDNTGIFPSMPANLSTLLSKLTHNDDWINVNINLIDSSDETGITTLSLPVSCIYDYINTSNTQINIYKDTSDFPIAQIKKALIDTDRAAIATSGADSRITFNFIPDDTKKELILSHEQPYLNLLIDDEIALKYEAVKVEENYINPFNLIIQFAENFDPSCYSQNPLITAVATDTDLLKNITSPCGYINFAQTTADGASGYSETYTYHVSDTESITYQAFSSSNFTEFYLLPIASNTASVYQEIPDFDIQITYDATLKTNLISSGTKFKLYDQNLYLKAVCDDSESFKQGTTFQWRLNGTLLDNPYVNLTTNPSYTGSYDIISCVAFYGNNIKSSSFSINAMDPVNSSIFIFKNNGNYTTISDIDKTNYTLDSYQTCKKPKVTFDKNDNVWWITQADSETEFALHGANDLIVDIYESVVNISYDTFSDTIYYMTSTSEREDPDDDSTEIYTIHVHKIPYATNVNYQQYMYETPELVFEYSFNKEYKTKISTAHAVDNYVTVITDKRDYYIFTPDNYEEPTVISLSLPQALSNVEFGDIIINEKNDSAYALLSEVAMNVTSQNYISRGGLISLPLTSDAETLTFAIKDIIGWSNSSYNITEYKNDEYKSSTFTAYTPTGTQKDSNEVFFGPRQFIAIREDELVFADCGFYIKEDGEEDSNVMLCNVNRLVKYDLKEKTISVATAGKIFYSIDSISTTGYFVE